MSSAAERPPWVQAVDAAPAAVHTVEDILATQGDPFTVLTCAANRLGTSEGFVILAGFDPQPLRQALATRGFETWGETEPSGQWRVRVRRAPSGTVSPTEPEASEAPQRKFWFDAEGLHIDVRGLEPPKPMIEVLRFLDGEAHEDRVLIHTPRFPVHLLPELEDRGWHWELVREAPGEAVLRVTREKSR